MKSKSPEDWIRRRAELSRELDPSRIDVADRVLSTLAERDPAVLAVDKTPLVVGGGLLALAASIIFVLFPSLTMMTEPWISFWML
ncbi:MAG: hypothetical protein AAGB04_05890 [Pseudomonadota bacterium]